MPELPEVETSVRGILPYLEGKTVARIVVRQKQLRWKVSDELEKMNGAIILSIYRRAKYLIFHTNQGDILVHLGMSGSLGILSETQGKPVGKHCVIHMRGFHKLPIMENIALITLSGENNCIQNPNKTAKSNYVKESYPWAVCWFSIAL